MGFEGRSRTFSTLKDGSYFYQTAKEEERIPNAQPGDCAFMLPGFFVHRAYLEMMFDPEMVPPEILDYVDKIMNCDDILFNMMVTKFLRNANLGWSAGLAVERRQAMQELSKLTPSNLDLRNEAISVSNGPIV